MNEAKRPKISEWVYEVLQQVGRPITRKAIVIELKHRGREVSHDQLGTALSNMRHRKQLVVTGNKLKKFSVSELPVAPWDRTKKDVVVGQHVEPVKQVAKALVEQKENMSGQESLMLVYMRVKIAAMVLCTGAVAGLAAVLAIRLYS